MPASLNVSTRRLRKPRLREVFPALTRNESNHFGRVEAQLPNPPFASHEEVQDLDPRVRVDDEFRADDCAGRVLRMHDLADPSLRVKVAQVRKPEFAGPKPCAEHKGDDELRYLCPP